MHVSKDCEERSMTQCRNCSDGTFQPGRNKQKQCSACTKCDAGKFILFNGKAPHATPICCVDENVVLSMFVSEFALFMFTSEVVMFMLIEKLCCTCLYKKCTLRLSQFPL